MKKILFALVAALALVSCSSSKVVSPDGKTQLSFSLTKEGVPQYMVVKNGNQMILPSSLGLRLDTADLTSGFALIATETTSVDTTWETVWGEERFITDRHNQLLVHLRHDSGILLDIVFRIFDDGFAFRYAFPEQDGLGKFTLLDEATTYCFQQDPEAWSIPWRTEYYEGLWQKQLLSHKQDTLCSPITLEFPDGSYGFLHEAALTNYPAENFYYSEGGVKIFLTPWRDAEGDLEAKAYLKAPFATPWRMLILTPTLPEMVASRIMLNLNEPCAIEDPSWIQPKKFIGIWWGMHLGSMTWHRTAIHGATTTNMLRYMRFAAEHGFGGVLAEGWNEGWETWVQPFPKHFEYDKAYPDFDMNAVQKLGEELGVEMIGHNETGGRADEYEPDLRKAFSYAKKHNIHAIKTGYVSPIIHTVDGFQWNKGQSGVRHYRKVIETAAKYHVAIDNHEPVMPTGLQRTWPNLMTQEGVRGQEWNAWCTDGGSPCEHVTVLPFTRIMAGPVDYTPGVFHFENPLIPDTRVHATLMNQLGLFVCFYSPLQMACDLPEHYMEHPDAFRFIEQVPCDWQRSILLDGKIGDFCVFARQDRQSDNWFVGGITDEEARRVDLSFDFLEAGRTYTATIYRDAADADWDTNPYAYEIEEIQVKKDQRLSLTMAAGGGFAISLMAE